MTNLPIPGCKCADCEMRRVIDVQVRRLNENREELVMAFMAKYECDPGGAVLCITPTGNSFIRKMTEDELAFRDLVHRRAQEAAGV